MDALLDGNYNTQLFKYQVVDCRFDYEFEGGHIPGAINVNNVDKLKEVFLRPEFCPQKPSLSGDSVTQTVLVFHCEFSAKRAPTLYVYCFLYDVSLFNISQCEDVTSVGSHGEQPRLSENLLPRALHPGRRLLLLLRTLGPEVSTSWIRCDE